MTPPERRTLFAASSAGSSSEPGATSSTSPPAFDDLNGAGATLEQQSQTISKAVIRASQILQITQSSLSEILGVSVSSVSRLFAGTYKLRPERKKEWELALLFLRLFRALDAIVGSGNPARMWLNGINSGLGGVPLDFIQTTEGLVRVVQYLDAHRGRI